MKSALQKSEWVNWQVGKLPPFDPLSRIAWCRAKRDVVLLRISESEERDIGPCKSRCNEDVWNTTQEPDDEKNKSISYRAAMNGSLG
jgi:hypothetical protein